MRYTFISWLCITTLILINTPTNADLSILSDETWAKMGAAWNGDQAASYLALLNASVDPHPPEGTPVSSQHYIQDCYEYIFNNKDTGNLTYASTFSVDTTPILGITTIPSWTYLPVPLSCSPENLQYTSMHKIKKNISESTLHPTMPTAYNSTTSACTNLVSSNKTQSSICSIAIMQTHQHESAAVFPHNSVHSTDLQSGVDTLTARKTHMRDKFFCLLNSFWATQKTIKKTTLDHTTTEMIDLGIEAMNNTVSSLSFFLLHSLGANRKKI